MFVAAAVLLDAGKGGAAFPGGNGRIVFTCRVSAPDTVLADELCVVGSDGSQRAFLTQTQPVSNYNSQAFEGAWSPDGRKVAFAGTGANLAPFGLYVINADGTGLRRLTKGPKPTCGELGCSMWYPLGGPSWSPDGRRIAFARMHYDQNAYDVESQVRVINADGSGERVLTPATGAVDMSPTWSPDGTKIAWYHDVGANAPTTGIWVMSSDGSGSRRLGSGEGPDWSPDGSKIAFDSGLMESQIFGGDIWVMNADGTGRRRLAPGTEPAWSPDGASIAFEGSQGLEVMRADGSGQTVIVSPEGSGDWPDAGAMPAWQPCPSACPLASGVGSAIAASGKLFATVGPGMTISVRDSHRDVVRKITVGRYKIVLRDRSPRHGFVLVAPRALEIPSGDAELYTWGTSVRFVGTRQIQLDLTPGTYRFYDSAHRRSLQGTFTVVVPD